MPSYSNSWDESIPSGTGSQISSGDDAIRAFKAAVRERVGYDHDIRSDESGITTIGYHKQCTFIETAALPSGETGICVLGVQTHPINGKPELCFRDENDNVCFLTLNGKIDPTYLGDLSTIPDTSGSIPIANLGNVSGAIPVGGIIWFSGLIANIPSNFAFCNGSNGTIDLRDKMIICGYLDDSGVVKTGVTGSYTQSGGEHQHTLTTNEMPAHAHTGTMRNSNGWDGNAIIIQGSTAANQSNTYTSSPVGGGAAHNNMPPYYALAAMQRIS